MAIATLIRTQAKMWGGHFEEGSAACTAQGFLMIYGGLSTFYWIMCIAIVMYTMIFHPFIWFKQNTIPSVNRISIAFNFLVPLPFAILPVVTGSYAPTGGWCWISNVSTVGKIFRWSYDNVPSLRVQRAIESHSAIPKGRGATGGTRSPPGKKGG